MLLREREREGRREEGREREREGEGENYSLQEIDCYELDHLDYKTVAQYPYLEGNCFKIIYLYHSQRLAPSLPLPISLISLSPSSDHRAFFTLFVGATKKASVFVVDRVRTNQMPNMTTLYQTERSSRLQQFHNYPAPAEDVSFDVRVDTELRRVRPISLPAVPFQDCAVQYHDPLGVPQSPAAAGRVQRRQKGTHCDSDPVPHGGPPAEPGSPCLRGLSLRTHPAPRQVGGGIPIATVMFGAVVSIATGGTQYWTGRGLRRRGWFTSS